MNGRLTVKSKNEWINQKPSRQNLSKKEATERYNQYLISAGVGGPKFEGKREAYRKGNNTGSTRGNPGGLKKTLGSISECTRDYALALMDPWGCPKPPCIPDSVVLPSYKFGTTARGTLKIGVAGCGWVNLSPNIAYNGSIDSDLNPVYAGKYTAENYTQTDYQNLLDTSGGVQKYANDSALDVKNAAGPRSGSDLPPSAQQGYKYRLVGAGIKVRYLGSEFARSGRIIAYRSPTNEEIVNGFTVNNMLRDREVSTTVNDRTWHYVTYRPVAPDDLNYRGFEGGSGYQAATLLLFIEGAEPGTSFEFETIQYFEVIGSLLPSKTRSHSDILGMAAVMQALPAHTPTKQPESDARSLISNIIETGKEVFSFIGGSVMPVAKAIAPLIL